MREGHCKGEHCGKKILWLVSAKSGKAIPVDPRRVTVITALGEYIEGYIPHWATCPDANEFRRGDQTR